MKIILSRKGFDSANGGCASPILPNGTMLSMPIPEKKQNENVHYSELFYNKLCYSDLLKQLNPNGTYEKCHLDPDIRQNIRKKSIRNWQPAFGQIGAAQGLLKNAGVTVGDIFLFFGWFHQTILIDNEYQFRRKGSEECLDFYKMSDLHVVYGYMQIGKIITDKNEIKKYSWHPHAIQERLEGRNNALYLPSEKLTSLNLDLPGYGVLNFNKKRVLTKIGRTRSIWEEHDFLMPNKVYGTKKNSAKNGGLYYAGIWQELVIEESPELLTWVKGIIE